MRDPLWSPLLIQTWSLVPTPVAVLTPTLSQLWGRWILKAFWNKHGWRTWEGRRLVQLTLLNMLEEMGWEGGRSGPVGSALPWATAIQ